MLFLVQRIELPLTRKVKEITVEVEEITGVQGAERQFFLRFFRRRIFGKKKIFRLFSFKHAISFNLPKVAKEPRKISLQNSP